VTSGPVVSGPVLPGPAVFGRLAVTLVECVDLPAMIAFYRDRLHLPVLAQGEDWISFDTGGGELVLGGKHGKRGITPGFVGADLEAAREALLGLDPTEITAHDTGRSFWIIDPDGNEIAFADHATRPER